MTTFIIIFILFVLYTVACCMDGPDLKPIWKSWLGNKLFNTAAYFLPVLKYYIYNLTLESSRIEHYHTYYEPIKFQCRYSISEMELFEQKMYGFNLSDEDPKNYCIKRAKEKCIESLMHNVKNSGLIDTQVIEDPYNARINVIAEIKLMKQQ